MVLQKCFDYLRLVLNNTFEQKVISICAEICIRTFRRCQCAGSTIARPVMLMTRIFRGCRLARACPDRRHRRRDGGGVTDWSRARGNVVLERNVDPGCPRPCSLHRGRRAFGTRSPPHRRYRWQRCASSKHELAFCTDNLSGIRQIKSFVREPEEESPLQ